MLRKGSFRHTESQSMFAIGDMAASGVFGDLLGNVDRLAEDFPDALRAAMKLVAPVFLGLCNNAMPSCPIDTGALISSSAVFVDGELVDFGRLDYGIHGLMKLGMKDNPRNPNRFSKFKRFAGKMSQAHGPTSLGDVSYSPHEVTITVAYNMPYAIEQHEGISFATGQPFQHYTRKGSGPKWVTSKFTLYKEQLSEQLGNAVNRALEVILGPEDGGRLPTAMSVAMRKAAYFNPNQGQKLRMHGSTRSHRGFTFTDERGIIVGRENRNNIESGWEGLGLNGGRIWYGPPTEGD